MLGYVGLPGAGVAYGYGSVHNIGFAGRRLPQYKVAALPQGENAVKTFIPVSRIADMLFNPGGSYEYNGQSLTYPDIRLIYWAGGNPLPSPPGSQSLAQGPGQNLKQLLSMSLSGRLPPGMPILFFPQRHPLETQ